MIALIGLLCGGCVAGEGDLFYLRSAGADMPVWVRGDLDAEVLVLLLHGGPGASALTYHWYLEALEARYAVAYWDQRGSGASQGNPDPATFTLDQFVADTDLIVDTLRDRYAPRALVLLGHSWGGGLGSAYLLEHQEKTDGWINVDGASDFQGGLEQSAVWVQEHAAAQVAAGERVRYWEKALDWYDTSPSLTDANTVTVHAGYVTSAHGYLLEDAETTGGWTDVFASPFSLFSALSNNAWTLEAMEAVFSMNLNPQMDTVTLPSLVLWGRHDGILPVALAQDAVDALGATDKNLQIFEDTAHLPMIEETEAFGEAVTGFIDARW